MSVKTSNAPEISDDNNIMSLSEAEVLSDAENKKAVGEFDKGIEVDHAVNDLQDENFNKTNKTSNILPPAEPELSIQSQPLPDLQSPEADESVLGERDLPLGKLNPETVRHVLRESLCNPVPRFEAIPTISSALPLSSTLRAQQVQMNIPVLLADGLNKETVERLHRLLLIYSLGFHRVLRSVRAASKSPGETAAAIWKTFSFLLTQCKPHGADYEMAVARLERVAVENIRDMVREQEETVKSLQARETELRLTVGEHSRQIQKLQSLHQFDEVTRTALVESVEAQTDQLRRVQAELDQLQATTQLWRQKHATFRNRYLMTAEDLNHWQIKNADAKKERDTWQTKLAAQSQRCSQLASSLQRLRQKIQESTERKASVEKQTLVCIKETEDAKLEAKTFQLRLVKLMEENAHLTGKSLGRSNLRTQYHLEITAMEAELKTAKDNLDATHVAVRDLSLDLKTKRVDLSKLRVRLHSLQANTEELRAKSQQLQHEVDEATEALAREQRVVNGLDQALRKERQVLAAGERAAVDLKQALTELVTQHAEAQAELAAALGETRTLERSAAQLEIQLDAKQAKQREQQAVIEEIKFERERELDTRREQLQAQTEKTRLYQRELEQLKGELEQTQASTQQFKQNIDASTRLIDTLQQELKRTQDEVSAQTNELAHATQAFSDLSLLAANTKAKLELAQQQERALKDALSQARHALAAIKEETKASEEATAENARVSAAQIAEIMVEIEASERETELLRNQLVELPKEHLEREREWEELRLKPAADALEAAVRHRLDWTQAKDAEIRALQASLDPLQLKVKNLKEQISKSEQDAVGYAKQAQEYHAMRQDVKAQLAEALKSRQQLRDELERNTRELASAHHRCTAEEARAKVALAKRQRVVSIQRELQSRLTDLEAQLAPPKTCDVGTATDIRQLVRSFAQQTPEWLMYVRIDR
jgi:chromosome segregation ATPase